LPELVDILQTKRNEDYDNKKFMASLKGIDLDKNSGTSNNEWEALKARVYSKGKTTNPNDIVALQGPNARQAGFGIGHGLDYEVIE
jgi:uncharacterized protein YvpB